MYNLHYDAKILWDYHHLNQSVSPKDCIIAFGSHDLHVAERAAQLYLEGMGKLIIFTGGLGRITQHIWNMPEGEKFSEIAQKMGVPKSAIFVESNSTNTGENIAFSKELIKSQGLNIKDFLVVDKPFKERRIYATLKKQWEEMDFSVTSPLNTYEEYCNYYKSSPEVSFDDFINIMVGDLQRIDLYGKNGFQIPQNIPEFVWNSYNNLIQHGYDKQTIK